MSISRRNFFLAAFGAVASLSVEAKGSRGGRRSGGGRKGGGKGGGGSGGGGGGGGCGSKGGPGYRKENGKCASWKD